MVFHHPFGILQARPEGAYRSQDKKVEGLISMLQDVGVSKVDFHQDSKHSMVPVPCNFPLTCLWL